MKIYKVIASVPGIDQLRFNSKNIVLFCSTKEIAETYALDFLGRSYTVNIEEIKLITEYVENLVN